MKKDFVLFSFLCVFLSGVAGAKNLTSIYVQNTTDSSLVMPKGDIVLPGEVALFQKIPALEEWNDIFVTGRIQIGDSSNVKPCQVAFQTYKNLDFHRHNMKTVIFVRHKKDRLVCSPKAVEFNKDGKVRQGGLRLDLKKAYHKIQRPGKVRKGKPYLVYEHAQPVIPYLYISPKAKHSKRKGFLKRKGLSRQESKLVH